MDTVGIFENPYEGINYENYITGEISGYQLGFQDREWYKINKDNFSNSVRNDYPDFLPYFAKTSGKIKNDLPNNYFNFLPNELIRFGKLKKASITIDGKRGTFWIVEIPSGLQVYHTSRSLGLNHSDFPVAGYNNRQSPDMNKKEIESLCPDNMFIGKDASDVMKGNVCTYVSYYSVPVSTKGYLSRNVGFGANQSKYAYGINPGRRDNDNKIYNDRLNEQPNEYGVGVQAYKTNKNIYLVIMGLDDYLIERPDLGRFNMRTFKNIMEFLKDDIIRETNITKSGFENFMKILLSVTGIGTLKDNADIIGRDYNVADFGSQLMNWTVENARRYLDPNTRTNTAGYIREIAKIINNSAGERIGLENFKGIRFSTYEHDKLVMNMMSWLFKNYEIMDESTNETVKIEGFVSSSMYIYSKGRGKGILDKPFIMGNDYYYYVPDGTFHSEMGIFYAPETLERDRDNKFDLEYSINYIGLMQELRKYKTTNITKLVKGKVEGFHQGHLLEHSTWVGMLSPKVATNRIFSNLYKTIGTTKDVYMIGGYFHDIGKSGDCSIKAVHQGFSMNSPKMSICNYVKSEDGNIVGMDYFHIPDHPEKGYEYMKGYRKYIKYTLGGIDSAENYMHGGIDVYVTDWEKLFEHLNLSEYEIALVRIAAGAHWYFGKSMDRLLKSSRTGENRKDIIKNFIDKIILFSTDEFIELDKLTLFKIILYVIIISIADILGSKYEPSLNSENLKDDKRATFINYFPNISLDNISLNEIQSDPDESVAGMLVKYALELQKRNEYKKTILDNIENNTGNFLNSVREYINDDINGMDMANNYSILFNLMYSYAEVKDIKIAYRTKFPKIITFDLDQTLIATTFLRNSKAITYHIYPNTYRVMEEVQFLRRKYFPDNPTYIAITSRHYAPSTLKKLLNSKEHDGKKNPLYKDNFDFIISRYTGPIEKIRQDLSGLPGIFEYIGTPENGFYYDGETGKYTEIKRNSDFRDLNKISKYGHFNMLKNKYGVEYEDIMTFDDDAKYLSGGGMGNAKDVFAVGVLTSKNVDEQGITTDLFRSGVANYVFDKIKQ